MADSLIDNTVDQTDDTADRETLLNKWKDKSKEEILEAKINSDLFIKTQNARFDTIREDYLKLREERQVGDELKDLIKTLQEKSTQPPDTTHDTTRDNVQPSLKPEEIDSLLEQKLTQRELLNKQRDNFNFIKAKIKEQFGDNAATVYKQRMDTLGLDEEFAEQLAKNHPTVFIKTFGLEEQVRQDSNILPRNTVRPDRFAPKVQRRDWNYYQELLKKDPRGYLDPKISVQMHNDAIELGDAFGMPQD